MLSNPKKVILCASNAGLTAGFWHGTALQNYAIFANDEDGQAKFGEYLTQHAEINLYLIVDAVEEDYRLESMPHTTGKAKREILVRKLNQFNRGSQYRAAHFINRAQDKRKDDNFLLVALNNVDFLKAWMDVIQANAAPLVGVYLLSMLSQTIVRQLKLMAPHILLCEQLNSGLRQTYLHNGRLRMSRLVPMKDVRANQIAYFYLVEIEKTRMYLQSQRLLDADTPLQMLLPATDPAQHEIAKNISQDQGLECKIIDILAFAKSVNIAPDLVKVQPALLHMQLLANGHVPDNLAPDNLRKTHNLNNIRRKINIATACIATIGLVLAAFYAKQGTMLQEQLQAITTQTQQQQRQYDEVAKNYPSTPIASTELKIAAELAQTIQNNQQTPRAMMQVLSGALEASPEISLNRMHWVQTNDIALNDTETGANAAQTQANTLSNQPAPPANIDPTSLVQIGFINAEVTGFTGDYRAALSSVNKFATQLRQNNLVETVTILQEPVNVSSLANLQGSTTDESTTALRPPALFKLKIQLKPALKQTTITGVAS